MTTLTYPKEENQQAYLQAEGAASSEAGQILHLKRLLVTLKQQYEKSLSQVQIQLQVEQNQRLITQKELEKVQTQLLESQNLHEEELKSLGHQQTLLKELLKKAQEELTRLRDQSPMAENVSNLEASRQQELEDAHCEIDQFHEKLNEAQKKVKMLEQELLENKQNSLKEIEHLQQALEEQKLQGNELETVVSTTSSHHLRRELEVVKRSVAQGNQETKALETRYIEVLNEKTNLEHQCKQLQLQFEHQSSNLASFQVQLRELEEHNKILENSLQIKEAECVESSRQRQELQIRIDHLAALAKEKEIIQDKYEQLKEEWDKLSEQLDEAIDMRAQADQHLNQMEAIAASQENQLQDFDEQLQMLRQQKGHLESERDQLKNLLEESEARLKLAQQHLAKKVKEAALLSEKVEEQQVNLNDFAQTIEYQKMQLAQLQTSMELYQRQEKRLQEQLHEALKGTESQVVKWEEKYFHMYDKWQESESRIRELRKFEEKHFQMQNLLANLGSFMGGNFNPAQAVFPSGQELTERPASSTFSFEDPVVETPSESSQTESHPEKYNLFGMRQPVDQHTPQFFS